MFSKIVYVKVVDDWHGELDPNICVAFFKGQILRGKCMPQNSMRSKYGSKRWTITYPFEEIHGVELLLVLKQDIPEIP